MGDALVVLPEWDHWVIVEEIDKSTFDFTWRPDPREPNMNYVFGNSQYDSTKMPTIIYKMEGATDEKHMPSVAKLLPQVSRFEHLEDSYGIDYSWVPDPTAPPYIYAWGNQWNKPEDKISIQYVVEGATEYKFMDARATRKASVDNWEVPKGINVNGFDFSWEPSPADPPFIYEFGTQWQKTGGPRYVVPDATEIKYVDLFTGKKLPSKSNWTIPKNIDTTDFDFSWHPDDTSPPYIYHFATQWALTGGPIYTVEGATEVKYIDAQQAKALPDRTNWEIPDTVDADTFDFSWHPYVEDQPYIYQFGTQWQKTGGPRYVTPGVIPSSPIKYIDTRILRATKLTSKKNFATLDNLTIADFDYSWHPDDTEEPYIYQFGNNQYPAEIMPTVEYVVPGATQIKYVNDIIATIGPDRTNWEVPENIDATNFDFSWKPNPKDPAYIYQFGTQWQKTGGPRYIVDGASEIKYVSTTSAVAIVTTENWTVPKNIEVSGFDFSWHPDDTSPPYIYHFSTQWALTGGPIYTVAGATEIKTVEFPIAKALTNKDNWEIPEEVDVDSFDFSWHPYAQDDPFIYQFGTQHQKTGGPRYVTPGVDPFAPIKYIDRRILKATRLPNKKNWKVPEYIDETSIDFSWHPDDLAPSYIYHFGTQWNERGGAEYHVPDAKQYKYSDAIVSKTKPNKQNWNILYAIQEDKFDFSWVPHPDDPPYIYQFGNNFYPAEVMPTVEYVIPGATQVKYITDIKATLAIDKSNWEIPNNIDVGDFDFSWRPNPKDPAYIYQFGTQWQKTGGPKYTVRGATEIKYVDTPKVTALPNKTYWELPEHLDLSDFDFSWHPDASEQPYIYQFGTQWALTGGPKYVIPGAKEVKYIDDPIAKAAPNKSNWIIPDLIDEKEFDFSWHPYIDDQPYIYQFGTQWQKTGGPKYVTPGADETSFTKYIDTRILKATRRPSKKNWVIVDNLNVIDFDYTWHPDETEQPYIYRFGNNQYPVEIMPTIEYVVPGATQIKYISDIIATLGPDKTNWEMLDNIDTTDFDFSWKPNPTSPPYIYAWGNQWNRPEDKISIQYTVEGATKFKYMTARVKRKASTSSWEVPVGVDTTDFDFSWEPNPHDPAFIYQFGTQHQKTGGPRYIVKGAKDIKYVDVQVVKRMSNKRNWIIPRNLDVTGFDFSWHPDDTEEPYIYQFGTQWQKTGGPRYMVKGATEIKYMDKFKATRLRDTKPWQTWEIPNSVNAKDFDFSWHPDDTEEPYIYQFGTQWSRIGGPRYIVKGATEIKYVDSVKAKIKADKTKWQIPSDIDQDSFDFSWQPDIDDQPYIYQFGTQWQKTGGPRYIVKGATEIKYMDNLKAHRLSNKSSNWKINIAVDSFDFSWHPDDTDEPYNYIFGNQWNNAELESTVEYRVAGATQIKYIHDIIATVSPNKKNWNIITDVAEFDFSWRPDPTDPPFTYVFGNTQYPGTIMPTVAFVTPGALQRKYVDDIVATLAQKPELFSNTAFIKDFDFSWRPNPTDPAYIYQFGTQWAKTHGPSFVVEGATETKYVSSPVATVLPNLTHWEIPDGVDTTKFDFSWHPDATSPAYIYQFGTLLDDADGPRYVTPNNNGVVVNLERKEIIIEELVFPKYYIKTTLEDLINEHTGEIFWALRDNINYDSFNFNWVPDKQNVYHINTFGSPESETTQTYFVNGKMWQKGYRNINFLEQDKKIEEINLASMFKKLDIFIVDRGNPEAQDRFEHLKARFGNVQKTRFLNSWVDTINRCINRSTTDLCWILNSELDYTHFDFEYYPNPWQMKMVHVFGTQWSHWGTTFIVNKETFSNDTKYIKIIEHLSNLNFVKGKTAIATNCVHDIVVIDHNNSETENVVNLLKRKAGTKLVSTIKFEKTYLDTFKALIKQLPEKKDHYLWICSSICDYYGFDFSYVCDPFARDQLHVFPSDKQKFGDTFFVDVNKLRELIADMTLLEEYKKINYNQHQRVHRLPAPVLITHEDTHFKNARNVFNFPYAVFVTEDNEGLQVIDDEPMSVWTPESKNVIITSTGGTRIVVPDEVKNYVQRELYDYPHIKKNARLAKSSPMDIVFLSNGEPAAHENYEHLLKITKGLANRVVRVDGVNGRVAAYHTAAEASNTPWMFTVFAKLKVNNKFDWNWQPDRLQIPKHYIFHAKNPVNGLVYGHQAMIAYNKKLTLANDGSKGLDFTQDDEHEVVELLSGVANYNTDEWSTWRTAFREVLKLKMDTSQIGKERLNAWLKNGDGDFGDYSILGAKDAVSYYKQVKGNIDKLKLSYEWEWLREFYRSKYEK